MFVYKTSQGKGFKTFKQLERVVGKDRAQAALKQIQGWVELENGEVSLKGFAFYFSVSMIFYHAECDLTSDPELQREFGRRMVEYWPNTLWKPERSRVEISDMISTLERDRILVVADPNRGPKTTVVSERVPVGGIH